MDEPTAYVSHISLGFDDAGTAPADRAPELADVRRYGRRLVNRWVQQAREAERPTFRGIIGDFLAVPTEHLPIRQEQGLLRARPGQAALEPGWRAATSALIGVAGRHEGRRHRGARRLEHPSYRTPPTWQLGQGDGAGSPIARYPAMTRARPTDPTW